jgi:hypothetical protein
LHPLSAQELNFPDTTYKTGKILPIICKTAGADPDNRIQTNYGKHDFFINNLTFESVIGMQSAKTTNVSIIQFDVYEPYSIGLFMLALQKAADGAGYSNWRDASFLLSIEFRGNKENGSILKVFNTTHSNKIYNSKNKLKRTRYSIFNKCLCYSGASIDNRICKSKNRYCHTRTNSSRSITNRRTKFANSC